MQQNLISKLLHQTLASSVGGAAVISDNTSSPIANGFEKLSSHRIHSLPVQDIQNNWVSFLDLSDVARHLFQCFTDKDLKHFPKIMEFKGEYLRVLDEKQKLYDVDSVIPDPKAIQHFRSKTVGEIAKHPFQSLSSSSTLWDVLTAVTENRDLRRVAIIDHGQLKRIVTSMDIAKLLASANLGKTGQLTLSELKLDSGKSEMITTTKDVTALDAFRLISQKDITGLPVVDSNNRVIGTITTSDLKAMMYDAREFIHLHLSVGDFLQQVKKKDILKPEKDVSLTSSSTISDLLNCFVKHRVHRVFVVDDQHALKGIITLEDFLSAVKDFAL